MVNKQCLGLNCTTFVCARVPEISPQNRKFSIFLLYQIKKGGQIALFSTKWPQTQLTFDPHKALELKSEPHWKVPLFSFSIVSSQYSSMSDPFISNKYPSICSIHLHQYLVNSCIRCGVPCPRPWASCCFLGTNFVEGRVGICITNQLGVCYL